MNHASAGAGVPVPSAPALQVAPVRPSRNAGHPLTFWLDRLVAFTLDPADALVVSGFWRSGTTWLQQSLADLLRAKTVYEPFHPLVDSLRAVNAGTPVASWPASLLEWYMPYCGGTHLPAGPLREHYAAALVSSTPGWAVRALRRGRRESLRRRVIVKLTRAQLSLHAAQASFGVRVVHLRRDPRAVVVSARRTGWVGLFDELRPSERLLDIPDGRADAFRPVEDAIRAADAGDRLARFVTYWAALEQFVENRLEAQAGRVVLAGYEDLVREPATSLPRLVRELDLSPAVHPEAVDWSRDSPTTDRRRRGVAVGERVAGWREELTPDECRTIERITRRFGLEASLRDAGRP